jgi:hypothetical protein
MKGSAVPRSEFSKESIEWADVVFWCGLGYCHSVGCGKGSFQSRFKSRLQAVPFSVQLFFVRFKSSFPGGERHRFSPVAGRACFAVTRACESRRARFNHAAEVANAIGSTINGSSFSGLLTLWRLAKSALALLGTVVEGRVGQARH